MYRHTESIENIGMSRQTVCDYCDRVLSRNEQTVPTQLSVEVQTLPQKNNRYATKTIVDFCNYACLVGYFELEKINQELQEQEVIE